MRGTGLTKSKWECPFEIKKFKLNNIFCYKYCYIFTEKWLLSSIIFISIKMRKIQDFPSLRENANCKKER